MKTFFGKSKWSKSLVSKYFIIKPMGKILQNSHWKRMDMKPFSLDVVWHLQSPNSENKLICCQTYSVRKTFCQMFVKTLNYPKANKKYINSKDMLLFWESVILLLTVQDLPSELVRNEFQLFSEEDMMMSELMTSLWIQLSIKKLISSQILLPTR